MGSHLGPILADHFLTKLENGPLNETIKKLDLYCCYIEDTFIVFLTWIVEIKIHGDVFYVNELKLYVLT